MKYTDRQVLEYVEHKYKGERRIHDPIEIKYVVDSGLGGYVVINYAFKDKNFHNHNAVDHISINELGIYFVKQRKDKINKIIDKIEFLSIDEEDGISTNEKLKCITKCMSPEILTEFYKMCYVDGMEDLRLTQRDGGIGALGFKKNINILYKKYCKDV